MSAGASPTLLAAAQFRDANMCRTVSDADISRRAGPLDDGSGHTRIAPTIPPIMTPNSRIGTDSPPTDGLRRRHRRGVAARNRAFSRRRRASDTYPDAPRATSTCSILPVNLNGKG